MGEINWTDEAEKWLGDIHRHIAQDNPRAAERVVTGIYRQSQVLADFPQMVTSIARNLMVIFAFFCMAITG